MYSQFFVMFAMIFTGFVLRKINFIREEMNNSLNKFIVYWGYPCLLAYNIGKMEMDVALVTDFFVMLAIAFAIHILYALIGKGYARLRHFSPEKSNVFEIAVSCPNNGFMGFPMGLAILGSEGLFLMTAENSAMNIFFFTYVLYIFRKNNADKGKLTFKTACFSIGKVLLNPNILAVFVGFIFALAHISLDNAVGTYMQYIGGAATPMAMIFIGSTLATSDFFAMFKNKLVIEATVAKLVVLPALVTVIMMLLPIDNSMKIIMVLGMCFPTAATVPMLAEQEKQDHELASQILFFSTVISMASVPLVITLIKCVFM